MEAHFKNPSEIIGQTIRHLFEDDTIIQDVQILILQNIHDG